MKTLSLISVLMFCALFGYSQNGGQSAQNALVKLEFVGYSNGQDIVKITNKQTCEATVEYRIGNQSYEVQIAGNGNYYLNITATITQEVLVKSKAKTFCGSNSDAGWVELKVQGNLSLPVVFGPITALRVGPNLIKLTFESEEDSDLNYYNILVSPDGKTWKKVQVLFPDGITGRKKYSILIKL